MANDMQADMQGALRHPDMRTKKQVTVRMTDQFAKDLNLIMASYDLQNATYVLQQSVAAQANAIRERMAERREVVHSPGKALLCSACRMAGHSVCV